jgi:hypothetical protein
VIRQSNWLGAALSFGPLLMVFGLFADKGNWVAIAASSLGACAVAYALVSLLKTSRRQAEELEDLRRRLGQLPGAQNA